MSKKTLFSGIQPTNKLTLGNYIGALRNWVTLQDQYDCIYSVVDLHAITVPQDPDSFRRQILETASVCIAFGVDPSRSTVFVQSHVAEHAELAWVLNCSTMMGELNRMTQFKEKSEKSGQRVGLFSYPVLMAADILLYDAELVPVGQDQKQHLELARDLGMRMNGMLGEGFFKIPEPYIPPVGAKIYDLLDPTSKMSKSAENAGGTIFLTDSNDEILKKFKRAVTDSETVIAFDAEKKPGVSNLLTMNAVCTSRTVPDVVAAFEGKQYGHLKLETAEAVIALLGPVRDRALKLAQERSEIEKILRQGADRARARAERKRASVYERMGLLPR
jgi:tryptophanyl-tRNA synthetase